MALPPHANFSSLQMNADNNWNNRGTKRRDKGIGITVRDHYKPGTHACTVMKARMIIDCV